MLEWLDNNERTLYGSSLMFLNDSEPAPLFITERVSYLKIVIAAMGFLCMLTVSIGCNGNVKEGNEGKTVVPTRDIKTVEEAHTSELMALPGVVGVYIGELSDHAPCIGVMVVKKTPELEQKIPKVLEGYPVKIDETGEIKPMK